MRTVQYALITATACLALAGCGKQESTTVTTTANGTTTVESSTGSLPVSPASPGIQPGKWQATVEITDARTSGGPAGMPAMPRLPPRTVNYCITPEEAGKGPEELLRKVKANANCTTTSSDFANGKIDIAMTCKTPTGTMSSNTTGTYSPTEMTTDGELQVTGGAISMTQKSHSVTKRIGECTG